MADPGDGPGEPDPLPADETAEQAGEPVEEHGPALAARRLHPAGAILAALDEVRGAAISVVVLIFVGAQSGGLGVPLALLAVGGAVAALAFGYVRWRAETYAIVGGAIHHRRGVVSPDETVVPLARVHSIDSSQGLVQRIFGVDELHVQTAGGGERGEIVLRAVAGDDARRLRALAGLEEPSAEDGLPAWRLSKRGLLLVGLTAPQLGILLPLVGALGAFVDDLLSDRTGQTLLDRAPTDPGGIALLVAAVAAGAWLVSFAGAIVSFAGFSIVRDGDKLRIHRGLLERRATSVPLKRVDALSIAEGPLRRPLGLCSVRIETTGYGAEPAAARTLFPLLRTAELDDRLRELVPALAAGSDTLEPAPARAWRRYVLPEALGGLVVGAAAAAIWHAAWPAIPVLAALGALDGHVRHRNAGWRLGAATLTLRSGSLTRRTLVAATARLQSHSLTQSPLQRRARLGDFEATVGSGTSARVAEIDAAAARSLFDRLRPTS